MLLVEFLSLFVPSAQGINHHIIFFNCSFLESTIFPGINQICYFIKRFHVMSSCSFWKVSSFLSHQMISSVAGSWQILFAENIADERSTWYFASCQTFWHCQSFFFQMHQKERIRTFLSLVNAFPLRPIFVNVKISQNLQTIMKWHKSFCILSRDSCLNNSEISFYNRWIIDFIVKYETRFV